MKRFFAIAAVSLALVLGLATQGDVSATSLSTQVMVQVKPTLTGTVGLASAESVASALSSFTLAQGTGLNQADEVYTAAVTLTTAATVDLDVKGSLLDAFGTAFTPAKMRLVYISSRASNTTNVTILGNAAAVPILNTVATTMTLTPGDVFLISRRSAAGITVTAATGDLIELTNAAGATAYVDVILVGSSS